MRSIVTGALVSLLLLAFLAVIGMPLVALGRG